MRAILSALVQFLRTVTATRTGQIALGVCLLCALLAVFAPWIAPYDPTQKHYDTAGKLLRIADPSFTHWLGTTSLGRDVLSQMIWGARPAMLVGLVVALGSAIIGANIGLLAGFYGGRFDNLLMRFTDIVMGVPFLPFVIVILSVSGKSLSSLILAMTLIMWRASARIVRAQVMSLKQMPFVAAARITGASDLAILYREIAPNIVPLALVNMAFALAWAITTEASIGFLGFGDPDVISWGSIIYDAFASQAMYRAPWWVAPPGFAIMVLVSAVYLVGREYERVVNPRLAGP
ncbi:MAG TPA: ABC transporter permease [Burkholderiaceae bacterium]|nr:ABC transporter permease [Rhodoferax sp.]HQX60616.1 ABC transporter permease [Burkholderiaceae bacterium]HQZ07960.1 ABC transporter permease [Burkholderiaceae bacterium]HRA63819.1 ABC transporter permease [Burkholderiaceae bacterium]